MGAKIVFFLQTAKLLRRKIRIYANFANKSKYKYEFCERLLKIHINLYLNLYMYVFICTFAMWF